MLRNLLGITMLVFSLPLCNVYAQQAAKPKNIILLIGDGMGAAQVSTAFFFQEETPNFIRFPYTGLVLTSAGNAKITDSAAGATAYASGVNTYNGAIGVTLDSVEVPTIVEQVSAKGYSTGVIATSSITHATPAAFYAHTLSRNQHEDIAKHLANSSIDFFAGGGQDFFMKRKDGVNYIDKLEENGFTVNTESLQVNGSLSVNNKYGFLLANDGMPRMLDGRGDFLPRATRMAINHLSQNEDGFFLMVEGSQIDWGGHANDSEYIVTEVLDFDKAVGEALDFAEQNGNTLVIVTADHETGGYSLSSKTIRGFGGTKKSDYDQLDPTFSTGGHSATMIPSFAFGPGAESFSGIYRNTQIYFKMMESLGQPIDARGMRD